MLIFSKENAQQLEATIVDLGKTIECQLIEADNTILTSKQKLIKQSLNDMKLQIECESQ